MKRNKNLALYALTIIILACGCKKFSLEETPGSFISTEQFYITEADATAAIYAAYECFFDINYYGLWWVGFPEMLSDYVNGRGGQASISNYSLPTSSPYFENTYAVFYKSINRANLVLKYVPDIEMDPALKDQIIAEARFIRALDYYNLVRGWGGVPLRTEPSDGLSGLSLPKTAAPDVYKFIIDELAAIENTLPDAYPTAQLGRATRWAAKTLLSEVYLTTEQWGPAAAKANEVIASQKFSLVQVSNSDDFLKIWGPEVLISSEEIFAIHFTVGAGSNIPGYMHRAEAGYSLPGSFYAWMGNLNSWIKDWDEQDLRRNYNMYNGPDMQWLSATVPMLFKKYRDPGAPGSGQYACDVLPFRYADVLLIAAEAESQANNGPTAAAYEALNQIRRRAYGRPLNLPAPGIDVPAALNAEQFRDRVIQERAYEFCIEGKRWWDLKRTGKAKAMIDAAGKNFADQYLLFPIPLTEIQNNDMISEDDQNPGWE